MSSISAAFLIGANIKVKFKASKYDSTSQSFSSVPMGNAALGQKDFAAAWNRGRTMTLEQALATQGREGVESATISATISSPTYPAGLTAREVGVLRLAAKGLTNAEIAQELKLSEKTIAHHLTHIFNKTNSENRAAAAAFAIRHDLA